MIQLASRYSAHQLRDLERIPQVASLPPSERLAMRVVASVLPFRVNGYVVDELIDWSAVPDDPIFRMTFPQREMLAPADFARMERLVRAGAPAEMVKAAARDIQRSMNPHPAGQATLNVPFLNGRPLPGMQHKYRETVLFFPSQGQTCHAYCAYCFRWPQFVGLDEVKFANSEVDDLVAYLQAHPEVKSVLFTGGDPMVMRTKTLRSYVEPLLRADLPHLTSIRFGTKAPAYWPQRFVTDRDADDLLRLFEEVVASGRTLAVMSHYTHPREISTAVAEEAVRRIRSTGAVVRCQSPIVRRVNDDAATWAELWTREVRLGAVPYYMFVERDTGPRAYFEVPLARALEVFRGAFSRVSGLARTVRGPSMSATPGKVALDGVAQIGDERVFVMRFLQARDPEWVGRPFFAQYDERATWLDHLRPALGRHQFFFATAMARITAERAGKRLPMVVPISGDEDEAA